MLNQDYSFFGTSRSAVILYGSGHRLTQKEEKSEACQCSLRRINDAEDYGYHQGISS